MQQVFLPADILLPRTDLTRWSVVACDQYSSEPDYWQRVEHFVGSAPSALRLILPEALLCSADRTALEDSIPAAMHSYIEGGLFDTLENSFIYTERSLADGSVRRGIIGRLDLEAYDYVPHSLTPVHSTEGTVEDRLPPRVALRARCPLELPHIVIFADDERRQVVEPLSSAAKQAEPIYDFELMENGGRIRGWRLDDTHAASLDRALAALAEPEYFCKKYGIETEDMLGIPPLSFAVGDGNHSLAAAKLHWEHLRAGLSEEQRLLHPARWALVELENLHDEGVRFEPIHRVVFESCTEGFWSAAESYWNNVSRKGEPVSICCVTAEGERRITVSGLSSGELIGLADAFLSSWVEAHGGRVDYIHGDDTARGMAGRDGCLGFILPPIDKAGLFPSLIKSGAFPRKSFSVGSACDKRFYLEARFIVSEM